MDYGKRSVIIMQEHFSVIRRKKRAQEVCTAGSLREEWHDTENGDRMLLLKFPLLESAGMVQHCFTTRKGGVSRGIYSTMNLSFSRGDDRSAVEENFRRLAAVLGADYDRFVFTDQTHTTNIRKVTSEDAGAGLMRKRDYTEVDGLITDEPGLVLSAFFADCVPLYFLDPVRRAIGLSHSGWRGTVKRMGAVTVDAMKREYGSRPEELLCAIGPSICRDCYEVSGDVAEVFAGAFPENVTEILNRKTHSPGGEEKYQLDLWRANEIVLLEAGVRRENIAVTDICTCCNPQILFSHRASNGRRGNLGGFLCLI